jgi:tetratricopeptide (TPR) repeat protein
MKKRFFVIGLSLFFTLCISARPGLEELRSQDEERAEGEKDVLALKAKIERLEEANAKNKEEINRLIRENKRLRKPDKGPAQTAEPSASEALQAELEAAKLAEQNRPKAAKTDSTLTEERYKTANEMYMRGDAAYKQGDLETARTELESALNLNPNLLAARAVLGDCLAKLKDYDGALAQHKILAERLPYGVEPYIDMADIYVARNDTQSAMKALNEAIAFNPDAELVHERMGRIYFDQKQYDRAKEEFAQELRVNPSADESRKYLKRIKRIEREERRKSKQVNQEKPVTSNQ